jgi:hypothetical protein
MALLKLPPGILLCTTVLSLGAINLLLSDASSPGSTATGSSNVG